MTANKDKTPAQITAEKTQDAKVQTDAATEMAKEAVKDEIALDTGTKPSQADEEAAAKRNRFLGCDDIQQFAYLLDAGMETLKRVTDKQDGIPENKIAGLLILERNGQNRTEYVKLLMKRLGIKDLKSELPQAGGPDYTNDTTNLSDL